MAITKTNFINYTRCPRYASLDAVKKEKLEADISYKQYLEDEKASKVNEILSRMYETNEDGEEIDLIDVKDRHLEAMLKYYNKVELLAGQVAEKYFKGTFIYSEQTKSQECFDFSLNGIKYLCYVDIYNEDKDNVNIIEVKASTTNKFLSIGSSINKEFISIFQRIGNILYLKDELNGFNIEDEMPLEKYEHNKQKLYNRFKDGKYVYDLAVQRYFIESEYKQSNNEEKLKNFKYYLAVLNHEYVFDGTYENMEPVYNPDENGNEIISFIDLTKITEELQPKIEADRRLLERYLFELEISSYPLGDYCEFKKQTQCKFFKQECGAIIPYSNSSLSYMDNRGFKVGTDTLKGLDLINEGYINLLDIPEEWIRNENHMIQRNCYRFNNTHINKDKISDLLNQIEYPIYHLDFETFPCPIPRFKGDTPYTQAPFEFSLHIEHAPGNCDKSKDNFVYLAKTFEDEREAMIQALIKYIDPSKGTMLAQNVGFEKSVLKKLAKNFPEYKNHLMKIHDIGFDLIWLLKTNLKKYEELGYDKNESKIINYYHPDMSGSYSIKKTLPVFSDLSYKDLVVKNGNEAITEYANYPYMTKEEFNLKYGALVEYCKQDTWAMVVILEALRKLVAKGNVK